MRSASTPPLLAGVCGVGVCLGSGLCCAPPLLAGVLGCVCVCVRAPLVPRHCRLGCAVWVCVLRFRFRLRPATPGWGVGVCMCSCARSACTPPLLAGVCRSGCLCLGPGFGCAPPLQARVLGCVSVRVRSPLPPRHSWLGIAVWVCVGGLRSQLRPATADSGVWGVCVFVCVLRLYPATRGWGVRCECVCLSSGFSCAPPLLAGVLGCVCVCVCAPLVPRHSWLGCAARECVLRLGFRLRPATPGWAVWVSVYLCVRSACTPPVLAGVCAVGVFAWARASASPRHSWLGCWGVWVFVCALSFRPATPGWDVLCGCVWVGSGLSCATPLLAGVLGCVCVCVRAPLVPCHSSLGCAV